MCEQIIKFCNGSTRPLLFVGASLTLLLAITIGYTACTTQALYNLIDPSIANNRIIGYYLQLAAAPYLILVATLSCFAAHYDQKHSIRGLALISAINCVLALAAVAMVPSGQEVSQPFLSTLDKLREKYDFKEPFPKSNESIDSGKLLSGDQQQQQQNYGQVLNSTAAAANSPRAKRWTLSQSDTSLKELNSHDATILWDKLQARGCCGSANASSTWTQGKIPKSCCASNEVKEDKTSKEFTCPKVDSDHEQGCIQLIAMTSTSLFIVLILIALVNLYLAVIAGINTYHTLHYSEASQTAYT